MPEGRLYRVMAIFEDREHFFDLRMIDRLTRIIRKKVLFRNISHIVAGLILGEEMIERLVFFRTAFFGNGVPPFLCVLEHGIDIKDHPPERMDPMLDNLPDIEFRRCVDHLLSATR